MDEKPISLIESLTQSADHWSRMEDEQQKAIGAAREHLARAEAEAVRIKDRVSEIRWAISVLKSAEAERILFPSNAWTGRSD